MRIYSEEILEFNQSCFLLLKDIIKKECLLTFKTKRFSVNGYNYPLLIESYQDEREKKVQTLAFFDANHLSISLNYSLCSQLDQQTLSNLLRHEFAHYLTYIFHSQEVLPHGKEFRATCQKFNWGKNVFSAKEEMEVFSKKNLNRKYKKLMRLSESSNAHEAQLALSKASALLLDNPTLQESHYDQEKFVVQTLLEFKRKNHLIDSIYQIMKQMHFGVCYHYGQKIHSLESYGIKEIVINSKEVFHYLDKTMNSLWLSEKNSLKQSRHSTRTLKNSFFTGFAQGVVYKLKQEEKSYVQEKRFALTLLEKQMNLASQLIYPHLRTSHKARGTNSALAHNLGFKKGQSFNTKFEKHKYLN